MNAAAGTRTCATCGSTMAPGAPVCTVCGATAASTPAMATRVPRSTPPADRGGALPVAFQPAPLGRRFGAYVIDGIWTGLLSGVLGAVLGVVLVSAARTATSYSQLQMMITLTQLVPALLGLAIGLVLVGFLAGGASPGMRLVGLRLVRFDDGGAPGFGKALGRQLVLVLSGFIIVGPFSPLFDRTGANRGWHDSASGTWVVLKDGVAAPSRAASSAAAPPRAPQPGPASPVVPAPAAPVVPVPAAPVEFAPVRSATAPVETIARPFATLTGAVPIPPAPAEPAPTPSAPVAHAPAAPAPASPTRAPSHRSADGLVTGVPGGAPSHAPAEDEDHTVLRSNAAMLPRSGAHPSAVRLHFGAGDQVVGGSALVGRDPAPRPGETVEHLITPTDAVRSMSKTHARIDVGADGVWITDRGSTNGTRIGRLGIWTTLEPNVRTWLPEGSEVEFGSVRATVLR